MKLYLEKTPVETGVDMRKTRFKMLKLNANLVVQCVRIVTILWCNCYAFDDFNTLFVKKLNIRCNSDRRNL